LQKSLSSEDLADSRPEMVNLADRDARIEKSKKSFSLTREHRLFDAK
jgi:hypothetical protein